MKFSNILWGLVFLILGVILGLNALEITNINIFFKGWWTLFLIIPSLIGLLTEKEKALNLILFLLGIFLLLANLDIIKYSIIFKLLLPSILIIIGFSLIFKDFKKQFKDKNLKIYNEYAVTFSTKNLNFKNEKFVNCKLYSIFGNLNCNLLDSKIEDETYIKFEVIFGSIKIIIPDDCMVKVISNSIFGKVSNKKKNGNLKKKIIYIDGTCLFGGVDIR